MGNIQKALRDLESKKVVSCKIMQLAQDSNIIPEIQTQLKEMFHADHYFTQEKMREKGLSRVQKKSFQEDFSEQIFMNINETTSEPRNQGNQEEEKEFMEIEEDQVMYDPTQIQSGSTTKKTTPQKE